MFLERWVREDLCTTKSGALEGPGLLSRAEIDSQIEHFGRRLKRLGILSFDS